MKYTGICVARQETIEYTTGDVGDPVVKNLRGISTTLPMPCEKFIWENEMLFDVFMP